MNKEKYSYLEYEVNNAITGIGYTYKIHTAGCMPYYDGIIESDEWFDTEQEARFAAIGHIDLLENGEG